MAETSIKRHPIAAVIWGIIGGIGVTLILIGQAVIAFGKWTWPVVIVVAMVILNLLWAYLGPAKKPKGPPPVAIEPEPVMATTEPATPPWEPPTETAAPPGEPTPPVPPTATAGGGRDDDPAGPNPPTV